MAVAKQPDSGKPPTGTASGTARGANGLHHIDPSALMRIKNLELRAKAVVDGFLSGLHRSPYHGFSVEFSEYRQYSPGDDLRFLDWRLYARTDRYYLKRFEDETNLRCYLLVDLSRSMAFRAAPRDYDKAEYAKTVAATIAYFLTLQRDAVGLITFDQTIRDYLPARFRSGHMHRVMMCLEQAPAGTATDLGLPLEQIAKTARKRGLVVLLSDLLAPIDTLETKLGYLRSQGHEVVVIRTLDPVEVSFQFQDESLFYDMESGRELYVDPQAVRASYQQRFTEHARELKRVCDSLGMDYYELTTDQPLDYALLDLLKARMRRGRTVSRRPGVARSSTPGGR
ncbi:MAG: domain containing CoxE-like protein [Planctomycetaceae bacterium]|nr:domain containing CoxE-like protein [Planctomycetaceae bacterium]